MRPGDGITPDRPTPAHDTQISLIISTNFSQPLATAAGDKIPPHVPRFSCAQIAAHGGAGSVNVSTLAEIATRAANAAAAVMTDPTNCGPLSWRSESWRDESWRDSLRESMRDDAPPLVPVVTPSTPDEPPVEEAAGVLGCTQARRPPSARFSPSSLTDEPTAEEAAGVLGRLQH